MFPSKRYISDYLGKIGILRKMELALMAADTNRPIKVKAIPYWDQSLDSEDPVGRSGRAGWCLGVPNVNHDGQLEIQVLAHYGPSYTSYKYLYINPFIECVFLFITSSN